MTAPSKPSSSRSRIHSVSGLLKYSACAVSGTAKTVTVPSLSSRISGPASGWLASRCSSARAHVIRCMTCTCFDGWKPFVQSVESTVSGVAPERRFESAQSSQSRGSSPGTDLRPGMRSLSLASALFAAAILASRVFFAMPWKRFAPSYERAWPSTSSNQWPTSVTSITKYSECIDVASRVSMCW